jgi:hypothetical protein
MIGSSSLVSLMALAASLIFSGLLMEMLRRWVRFFRLPAMLCSDSLVMGDIFPSDMFAISRTHGSSTLDPIKLRFSAIMDLNTHSGRPLQNMYFGSTPIMCWLKVIR